MQQNLQQLDQLLSSLQSNNNEIRKQTEEQMNQLPPSMLSVMLTQACLNDKNNSNFQNTYMAALYLKQLVRSKWDQIDQTSRSFLKENIISGLTLENKQLGNFIGLTIAEMAAQEFPEQWPQLFNQLVNLFQQHKTGSMTVYSIIKCISLIVEEVSEESIFGLFPSLMQMVFSILQSNDFPLQTKSKCLKIIYEMLLSMGNVSGSRYGKEIQSLLTPVLPSILQICLQCIQNQSTEMYGLKLRSLQLLSAMFKYFMKQLMSQEPLMQQLLQQCFQCFAQEYDFFLKQYYQKEELEEEGYDSEGDMLTFATIMVQFTETLSTLIFQHAIATKLTQLAKSNPQSNPISQLSSILIGFIQMTTQDCEQFVENGNQYIIMESEDDASNSLFTIRNAAMEVLLQIVDRYGLDMVIYNVQKRLQESSNLFTAKQPHWWKLREACLFVLGSNMEELLEHQKYHTFCQSMVSSFFSLEFANDTNFYLLSRALWVCSRALQYCTKEQVDYFVNYLMQKAVPMYKNGGIAFGIYLCKSIYYLVRFVQKHTEHVALVQSHQSTLISFICQLLQDTIDDTVHLPLETLAFLMKTKLFAISSNTMIVSLLLQILLKFGNDPTVPFDIIFVFQNMILNAETISLLLPFCIKLFTIPKLTVEQFALVSHGMDLCKLVIFACKKEEYTSNAYLQQVFGAVTTMVLNNDDVEILQYGTDCLASFVYQFDTQLSSQHVALLLQVTAKLLLHPTINEDAILFVGNLAGQLLLKLGPQGLGQDTFGQLLSSLISKLVQTSKLALIQSICVVLSKMILQYEMQMIQFMQQSNVLVAVIQKWSENQEHFFGKYRLQVTCSAWIKIMTLVGDTINGIQLEVEDNQSLKKGYQTRSKGPLAKRKVSGGVVMLSVLMKILVKLKMEEKEEKKSLRDLLYESDGEEDAELEEEEEDEEEGEEEEENLGAMIERYAEEDDEEDDHKDPFSKDDPLHQIQLDVTILQFLKSIFTTPLFQQTVSSGLVTAEELQQLQQISAQKQ